VAHRVTLARLAIFDVHGHSLDIAAYNRSAGRRFVRAISKAQDLLSDHPYSGMSAEYLDPEFSEMRKLSVPGFNKYLVFYRVLGKEIEILRILHGAQDLSSELRHTV
jgi:toxin ParE1/3/4